MNNKTSLILAALLPLSIFSWFQPTQTNQIDFWLLWLVAMIIIALPMLYAEIALSNRSGLTPWAGVQHLTREADVGRVWRSFVWLSIPIMCFVAAALISGSSSGLADLLNVWNVNIPEVAIYVGLMIIAFILSFLGVSLVMVALGLLIAFLVVSLTQTGFVFNPVLTSVSVNEWARAVMMALVSVGVGSGIYWYNNTSLIANSKDTTEQRKISKQPASKTVLPIWFVQVCAGLVSMLLSMQTSNQSEVSTLMVVTAVLASISLAAVLLHFAVQFVKNSHGMLKAALTVLVLACLFVMVPNKFMLPVLVVLTVISAICMSIFVGWQMKISHLRKSLNFNSEATYNIWRVAIRLVVPIAVVVAMLGWIKIWL